MKMRLHEPILRMMLMLITVLFDGGMAVKCLDCVGRDCMGTFCEGDYCVLGRYAPRWGTIEWGESRFVKGCMSGTMLETDIRSHCETVDDGTENGDSEQIFTCFCNKDYCNGERSIRRMESTPVQMVTCICNGAHCTAKTCVGELCSFVINHRTHKSEQGCVNASVPLIERRSSGACMIPPITGAMHHTVSRDAHQLLATESCVCATDFCNSEKPEITVNEKMKCNTFVTLHVMGTKVSSRNTTCTGEYCFKASIKSKIGHMNEYKTMGCASFIDGAELVEELQPVGCAKFQSEKVTVETCFQTKDRSAIGRARANQEAPPGLRRKTFKKITKTKNKYQKQEPTKVEIDYDENQYEDGEEDSEFDNDQIPQKEEDNEEEEKEEEEKEKESEDKEEKDTATDRKEEEKEDEKEGDEGEEEEGENEEKESESDKENDEKESSSKEEEEMINVTSTTSKPVFIFEGPTEASIPEESNATLVFVFVLIMILIVMTGIVWKFGLHKRLFRAKYDTVAGG